MNAATSTVTIQTVPTDEIQLGDDLRWWLL
jgi:hypothetical protein